MKQIFAFEDFNQLKPYTALTTGMFQKLQEYQFLLEQDYALKESPKAVVWTSTEIATTIFSNIPIPAYTRKNLIYMSPIVSEWKEIFFKQLDNHKLPVIQHFYERNTESEMLSILAHELTHHSDLFMEDFEDGNWEEEIWFEEGMCFYLPRKLLLTEEEFEEISTVEKTLIKEFKAEYGNHSLSEFGKKSYTGNLTSIMYDYWRSYIAVKELVERENGDVMTVFKRYHKWYNDGKKGSLLKFFKLDI